MEEFLSRRLGVKVNLFTEDALKPVMKERILKETVYVQVGLLCLRSRNPRTLVMD